MQANSDLGNSPSSFDPFFSQLQTTTMSKDLINYYSKNADKFVEQYENLSPEKVNQDWLQFIPVTKSLILDAGSGSGRDSGWLASMGHEVVSVEPADSLRKMARVLHPDPSIQWIKDSLPSLEKVCNLGLKFDLILVNALWMHIAPGSQEKSFRKLVDLLKPGGKLVITLRHGPSPDERRMHPVNSQELQQLAKQFSLEVILDAESADLQNRSDVLWHTLVFGLSDE